MSGTQGLWPAFWMLGRELPHRPPWPASGEIDIMEHVGRLPNQVFSTLHAPAYNGGNGDGLPFTGAGDFAAAFHTYGMDWDASHMTFYVDGHRVLHPTKAQVEATRGPWVFDHPFFVILNNAVGGDFPGNRHATTGCRSGCSSTTCGSSSSGTRTAVPWWAAVRPAPPPTGVHAPRFEEELDECPDQRRPDRTVV